MNIHLVKNHKMKKFLLYAFYSVWRAGSIKKNSLIWIFISISELAILDFYNQASGAISV